MCSAPRLEVLVKSVYAQTEGLMEGNISTMRKLFTQFFAETLTRPIHQWRQIFFHRPVVTLRHSGANGQWEGYSLDKEGLWGRKKKGIVRRRKGCLLYTSDAADE